MQEFIQTRKRLQKQDFKIIMGLLVINVEGWRRSGLGCTFHVYPVLYQLICCMLYARCCTRRVATIPEPPTSWSRQSDVWTCWLPNQLRAVVQSRIASQLRFITKYFRINTNFDLFLFLRTLHCLLFKAIRKLCGALIT